jgi:hypothetical protein
MMAADEQWNFAEIWARIARRRFWDFFHNQLEAAAFRD